jgi:hypothetical protein
MRGRWPSCGYRFEREEGFLLGAYVVDLGVTKGLLLLLGIVLAIVCSPPTPTRTCCADRAGRRGGRPLVFCPFSRTPCGARSTSCSAPSTTWSRRTESDRRPGPEPRFIPDLELEGGAGSTVTNPPMLGGVMSNIDMGTLGAHDLGAIGPELALDGDGHQLGDSVDGEVADHADGEGLARGGVGGGGDVAQRRRSAPW